MSVKIKLDAIEQIVKTFESSSELERFQSYATIKVLTDELAAYAESNGLPHGLIREKITELLDACRGLAYLTDRGTRDDSWYIRRRTARSKSSRRFIASMSDMHHRNGRAPTIRWARAAGACFATCSGAVEGALICAAASTQSLGGSGYVRSQEALGQA